MELLAAVTGIFGAILGAIVGAWATRRLNRAQPVAFVDQVEIGSNTYPAHAKVTPNRALTAAIDNDPFIRTLIAPSAEIKEHEYINLLEQILEEINHLLGYRLPTLNDVADRLLASLRFDEYEAFESLWAEEAGLIWGILEGAYIRQEFSFSTSAPDYNTLSEIHDVLRTPDGDFVISLPGIRDLYFVWSTRRSVPSRSREFAERVANAFGYRVKSDLLDLVKFLRGGRDYGAPLKDLRSEVQREIEHYHRLILRGQVSNTGNSPFSIHNKGKAFILTSGYRYGRTDESGNKTEEEFPDDIHLSILLTDVGNNRAAQSPSTSDAFVQSLAQRAGLELGRQEDAPSDYDSPLSVAPGQICRFFAVSEARIADLQGREVLQDVLRAGERQFYVGLATVRPGRKTFKVHYTAKRYFRDWKAGIDIPPQ